MTRTLRRELTFPQKPEVVWRALTSSEALAEWMYANDFEARVGYQFTFRVPPRPQASFEGLVVRGEVLTCVPPSELTFTWVAGELNTKISYRLEPDGSGTRVYFEHSGFEAEPAFRGAEYGWKMMHARLAKALQQAGSYTS